MTPAAVELDRAIRDGFPIFGATAEIEALVSRPWASITFSGERHRLTFRIEGERAPDAADAFLDGLSEREFELRGHIMADIALVEDARDGDTIRLTLEALTVEAS
ncbi:MAG TPA: hypothetical protein VES64_03795 [Allosphingosinicella sp.]|nr:hypothetical protein [Allosphingosinicella sp.]